MAAGISSACPASAKQRRQEKYRNRNPFRACRQAEGRMSRPRKFPHDARFLIKFKSIIHFSFKIVIRRLAFDADFDLSCRDASKKNFVYAVTLSFSPLYSV